MRHALSLAGVVTLLSVVSVRGQQADIVPPEVDNKWVFFVPGPISRAPDGLRITVPFSLKNADFKGTIIYLARFHEVNAFDNSGVRCGTNFGNIIVTGLTSGTDRQDALPLTPDVGREVVVSLPCEKPALGERFALGLELVIYIGTSERAVRISWGWFNLPVK